MPTEQALLVAIPLFVVAFLYSSVGHAGASGYIATMTLFGIAAAEIRPLALVLNILVATITTIQFRRAGHFSWALFWPFAALAVPLAFVGGYVSLPTQALKVALGVVLWFSAARFLVRPPADEVVGAPSRPAALSIGAGLGLLSGLTGTGGGIFLTPILLLARWATAKRAAAVSALFILVNSVAGLLGNLGATRRLPAVAAIFAVAVVLGGLAGSHLGSRRFDHTAIKRCLAVVLLIAGYKLLFA